MSSNKAVTLTAADFDATVLAAGKTAVVDFWAPWCPPCRALAPAIEALASERPDVVVGKLNVDEQASIAERYGIQSIPTVLLFRNGELAGRSVGLVSLGRLHNLVGSSPGAEAKEAIA
jgi:thioredoxin 1